MSSADLKKSVFKLTWKSMPLSLPLRVELGLDILASLILITMTQIMNFPSRFKLLELILIIDNQKVWKYSINQFVYSSFSSITWSTEVNKQVNKVLSVFEVVTHITNIGSIVNSWLFEYFLVAMICLILLTFLLTYLLHKLSSSFPTVTADLSTPCF